MFIQGVLQFLEEDFINYCYILGKNKIAENVLYYSSRKNCCFVIIFEALR